MALQSEQISNTVCFKYAMISLYLGRSHLKYYFPLIDSSKKQSMLLQYANKHWMVGRPGNEASSSELASWSHLSGKVAVDKGFNVHL